MAAVPARHRRPDHRGHQGEPARRQLGAVDVHLDADALARLDEASAVPLGFPHDFAREPAITRNIYGDRWPAIDDRRSTHRRTVHDVL